MKTPLLVLAVVGLLGLAVATADVARSVRNANARIGEATQGTENELGALVATIGDSIEAVGGVEHLAEPAIDQLIDRLNESGYNHEAIDPNEPLLKQRIILICEGMNERVARSVVERLIHLDALDPEAPIDLRIATSGGWTDSAFAIVDTMRAIRAPVDVTAIGGCYSAGTVILAAGTGTRAATPNALLSVHVNDFQPEGDLDFDGRELARFRRVYEQHTDVPQAWFDAPGDNQYYLDAQQALRLRLIDKIATPKRDAAPAAVATRPAA